MTSRPSMACALAIFSAAMIGCGRSHAYKVEKQRLLEMGMATRMFYGVNQQFPPASRHSPELSWRVGVLPFMELQTLYEQLDVKEAWDSERNSLLAAPTPPPFASHGEDATNQGLTGYVMVGRDVDPYADGAENRILIVRVGPDKLVPWMKPDSLRIDPADPAASLGNVGASFWAFFADVHVELIPSNTDPAELRRMFGLEEEMAR